MADVSSLQLKIDSKDVGSAATKLKNFAAAAEAAEIKSRKFQTTMIELSSSAKSLLDKLTALAKAQSEMNATTNQTTASNARAVTATNRYAVALARLGDGASKASAGMKSMGAEGNFNQITKALGQLSSAGQTATGTFHHFSGIQGVLATNFNLLGGALRGGMLMPIGATVAASLLAASAVIKLGEATLDLAKSAITVGIEFEKIQNIFKVTSTSQGQVADKTRYVIELAQKMGLEVRTAAEGFAKLDAATRGTALQGEAARKVFEGLSTASVAMGWDAQTMSLALKAFTDMISKGTVRAEELKRQLGNHMPGALNMAARAMGVTTEKLDEMMKKGQLLADDFLPKFAAEMQRTFGEAAAGAMNSTQASMNRLSTAWDLLLNSLSDTGIKQTFTGLLQGVATAIQDTVTAVNNWMATPAGKEMKEWFLTMAETLPILIRDFGGVVRAMFAFGAEGGNARESAILMSMALREMMGNLVGAVYAIRQYGRAWDASTEGLKHFEDMKKAREKNEEDTKASLGRLAIMLTQSRDRRGSQTEAADYGPFGNEQPIVPRTAPKDKAGDSARKSALEWLERLREKVETYNQTKEATIQYELEHDAKLQKLTASEKEEAQALGERLTALGRAKKAAEDEAAVNADNAKWLDSLIKKDETYHATMRQRVEFEIATVKNRKQLTEAQKEIARNRADEIDAAKAAAAAEQKHALALEQVVRAAKRASQEDDLITKLKLLQEALSKGLISTKEYYEEYKKLQKQHGSLLGDLFRGTEQMADIAGEAFVLLATRADNANQKIKDMVRDMLLQFARLQASKAFNSLFQKGVDLAIEYFGGGATTGKAEGGTVMGGRAYMVGERGPEIFTPATTGSIQKNSSLGGGNVNHNNVSIVIQKDGSVSAESSDRNLRDMAMGMKAMVLQILEDESRTGGRLNPVRGTR